MAHTLSKKLPDCLALSLILLLGLALGALYAVTYKMHFDVSQMLDRGVVFFKSSKIIFYGNASSGGMGKVPGGLTSLLVGLPLKIYNSPYSVLGLLSLLHLASFFLIYQVLRKYFSSATLIVFAILFWLSPWRVSEIYIWNPSYLFFATALHLWSAHKMAKCKSFVATFCHIFAIFFAFQIHNSSIILVLISVILFFQGRLFIHWTGCLVGALLGVGSLIPYLQAMLDNPDFTPEIRDDRFFLFRGLLYVFPMLKAVWYWVRFASGVFPKHIYQHMEFAWLGSVWGEVFKYLFIVLKYGLGALTAIFSIRINYLYFKQRKSLFLSRRHDSGAENFLVFYTFAAFIAMVAAAALSPIDLIYWHLIILFPIGLFPILDYVEKYSRPKTLRKILWIGLGYFIAYNFFAAMGSGKHSVTEKPHQNYIEKYNF